MSYKNDRVLIYDIECATIGKKPDIKTDMMKFFGAYSYITDKYYVVPISDKKFIQKLIDSHKFLVGFNNKDYDDPIIQRHGFSLEYKRIIDLREIFKKRAGSMFASGQILSKALMSYSLDFITRFLKIVDEETAKDTLDYNIFKKNTWTQEEKQKIKHYTERDLEVTRKLYEWVEDYFEGFKDFVPEEEYKNKKHLTDTMAKYGYKADCYFMNWEPVYNTDMDFNNRDDEEKIAGGYVAYPAGEQFSAIEVEDANNK